MAETDQRRTGPTRGAERYEGIDRWPARRWLARLVRVGVAVAPILVGCTVTLLLNPRLPFDRSAPQLVARFVVLVATATAVVVGVERAARRLLPLAVLLDLSLVFPDHAPSRFRLAIRSGSTRQLSRRVQTEDRPMNDLATEALGLVALLNAHDRRTRGHSERVRAYAVLIGEELKLSADELDKLQWAALLHDVGKLAVPAEILNKNGRPTDDEWAILAGHPAAGVPRMEGLEPWLGEWIGAAGEHHERWDGKGYPRGLSGQDISRAGRIVAVADAFEVMTAVRSYKRPMSIEAARTEVTSCASGQFDPVVVRALLNVSLGNLRSVAGPIAGLLQLPLLGQFVSGVSGVAASGALASVVVATGIVGAALVVPTGSLSAAASPGSTPTTLVGGPGTTTAGAVAGSKGTVTGDPAVDDGSSPLAPDGTTSTTAAPGTEPTSTTIGIGGPAVSDPTNSRPGAGATTTTTTSLAPTTTTEPTDAAPPSTEVPVVTPTPTTPVVNAPNGTYFLGTSSPGDTHSSAMLPLGTTAPNAPSLANYDTDRDGAPGLSLKGSGNGGGDTMQLWSIAPNVSLHLASNASLTIWGGPKNFGGGNRTLLVALYDCSAFGGGCQQVTQGSGTIPATGTFAPVTIGLGSVTRVFALGRQLVLRVQCSSGPCWLAYGTAAYPAALTFS